MRRGRDWRAQFSGRSPPFIGARGGRRAELGSPASSLVQGCEEARSGRVRLVTSRRSSRCPWNSKRWSDATASLTGAAAPWRTVADAVVTCDVPAGKWPCPGGAGWRRASTGAEIACGGDASWWRDDVAGHVCDARRARSVVHGHVWACRGVYGLVRLVHQIVEAGVGHAQGSVESKCDKVMHAGEGQRERESKWVACHATAWMQWVKVSHLQCLAGDGEGEVR